MARYMHKNALEVFRVIVTTTINERTFTYAFGPYHDIATARGIITREWGSFKYRRGDGSFSAAIDKSPLAWETVETSPVITTNAY